MVGELQEAGVLESIDWNDGFHAELEGKNGGGDPWRTDGQLAIVLMRGPAVVGRGQPQAIALLWSGEGAYESKNAKPRAPKGEGE